MDAEACAPVVVYHHRTQGVDAQGIHVVEMCRAFEQLGYSVVKVAVHADERPGSVSRSGLLSRLVASMPRPFYELMEIGYNAVGVVRLWQAARRHRPAFIYERYSLFNICGVLVSRLTGIPVVVEFNSPLAYERQAFGGLTLAAPAQAMENWIARKADLVVAVSGVLRDMLVAQGATTKTIAVMPNGINPADYARLPAREPGPDRTVTLGFVGWFREWHGLAETILALDANGIFAAGASLVLVGDGPSRESLEALIRERGLFERVRITGPTAREALFTELAAMDIALQPAATTYASPMKLIEYLAAGKAIIAPDQANIRELIRHGENGLLFPPGDWDALAQCVRQLLAAPERMRCLGENARGTVAAKDLTWTGNARRVRDLLAIQGLMSACVPPERP